MIGHLYRYPSPIDSAKFIYVGQGRRRDPEHRRGGSSFGRRFKKLFPNIELPQPTREQVEVQDIVELNELETIWMFKFHTWLGYAGGMNLRFPGDTDYKNLMTLEQRIENGRKATESGQLAKVSHLGGEKSASSGKLAMCRSIEASRKGGVNQSLEFKDLGRHVRWHARRNIVKKGCEFCEVT